METTSVQTNTTAASRGTATTGSAGASALSSDFETFLRMLTVQMQNQDPLNPIQSSDFAVQLATFSGVEQQIRTNELIASLAQGLNLSGMAGLSGWVGMEGRAPVPARFDGAPVPLVLAPPSGADQVTLIVRDADGRVVTREAVPAAGGDYAWSGTDEGGAPVPFGLYSFELESRRAGEFLSADPIPVYSRITEARLDDGETVVVFEGGSSVRAAEVTALRAAG